MIIVNINPTLSEIGLLQRSTLYNFPVRKMKKILLQKGNVIKLMVKYKHSFVLTKDTRTQSRFAVKK